MIQKILRFTKVEHTAFSLPLLFTGAWMGAGGHWPQTRILVLIVAAAVGARIFGMSCNRIFDRQIDAHNPRTAGRELPSGNMNLNTALAVALSGLLLYLAACVALGRWCLYLAPLPLIPLLTYSLLKRFTALCHFGIGLCLALAPLGAFTAAAGHPYFTSEILLFSGYVFFWLSGADIIYALMDVQSDRSNGIHSIPASLGVKGAQVISAAAHLAALILLAVLVDIAGSGWAVELGMAVTALFFILMYLPFIPTPRRFFPVATLAGICGAITPILV
jgi:4-hydroxybenzoate polyprenyltransferase